MQIYAIVQGIQCFFIHVLIFISWKQGSWCWLAIAPYLYFAMLILSYALIPIGLAIYTDVYWEKITEEAFFLQIFFSFGIQIGHLLNFYFIVYKMVLTDAKDYIAKRERK